MKNAFIFIGGAIVGAYCMYSHMLATAAKVIIDKDKKEKDDE